MKQLLIISAVIAALFVGTQLDDPLNDDVLALLDKIGESKQSESYFYFLGINAPADIEPIDYGKKVYSKYKRAENDATYETTYDSTLNNTVIPKGKFFCKRWESGCLMSLFSDDIDYSALLSENALLISRVKELHAYKEYQTQIKPLVTEVLPDYAPVLAASRLNIAAAIVLFKEGRADDAVRVLFENISVLRYQLAIQDTIIGKVIYAAQLSEHLDVASIILNNGKTAAMPDTIPNLSLAEKQFDVVMAREFISLNNIMKDLDRSPDFWQMNDGAYTDAPGWLVRMAFKPNMTINAVTPIYNRAIALSVLEPSQFAIEMTKERELPVVTSKLRNYAGAVLANISGPNYDEYVARIMDLDVKIELFNQYYHNGKAVEKISNPYFKDKAAFVDSGRICFDVPLTNDNDYLCLITKLEPVSL